jgi:hypothetical protein
VKKSVDKSKQRCYNKYVPKREQQKNHQAKKIKKVKKMLDKRLQVWYNKDVPRGNEKNILKGIGDYYGKETDYR